MDLDRLGAGLFGMSQDDLKYITSAMVNDGFLKQLRPNLEHRGLRIQPGCGPQPERPVRVKKRPPRCATPGMQAGITDRAWQIAC